MPAQISFHFVKFHYLVNCFLLCAVVMYIGDMEFKAQAPGPFVGLDLNEELYVGAVPDFSRIARAAGFASGFTG